MDKIGFEPVGLNPMDYSKHPAAFECRLADGADYAASVVELLA